MINHSICYLLIDSIDFYQFKESYPIKDQRLQQANLQHGFKPMPKPDLNNLLNRLTVQEKEMINAYTSIQGYLVSQN